MGKDKAAYQLVVMDVDGTLLDSRHQLSSDTVKAIGALRDAGVLPILASGRPRIGVSPVLASLGIGPAHIGAGGAYAIGPDGAILFSRPVPAGLLPRLILPARKMGLDAAVHTLDQIFLEGSHEHETVMRAYNGAAVTRVEDVLAAGAGDPCKVTLYGEPAALARYRAETNRLDLPVEIVNSTDHFLEINSRGVSKGNAVTAMAEQLGIPLGRVVAIGDQFNDLSMFAAAGLAIAMGNAPEEVKRKADVVAPSNDEGGVAWAVGELIL